MTFSLQSTEFLWPWIEFLCSKGSFYILFQVGEKVLWITAAQQQFHRPVFLSVYVGTEMDGKNEKLVNFLSLLIISDALSRLLQEFVKDNESESKNKRIEWYRLLLYLSHGGKFFKKYQISWNKTVKGFNVVHLFIQYYCKRMKTVLTVKLLWFKV